MAWGEKYRLGIYDLNDIPWVVKFYKDGWEGDVITIKGGDTPITFSFLNTTDNVIFGIQRTEVRLSILATANFMYSEIVSSETMSTYVEVFPEEYSSYADPYWVGYVDPGQYEEPYEPVPYTMEIVCTDGLSLLESIKYAEQDSTGDTEYYQDRRLESQIILDILGKIGYTEFKEYLDLYEQRMESTADDSPLDQVKADVDLFYDRYCDEVLEQILQHYMACIRQKDGVFHIWRPETLIRPTVYGRYFTAAQTKTSISFTPAQYINRDETTTSDIKQVPGGVLTRQLPASKVILHQNYGYKESWIDNHKVPKSSYDPAVEEYDNWTPSSDWSWIVIPGETNGISINPTDELPPNGEYVEQSFGDYGLASSNMFIFSFEYLTDNQSGGARTCKLYMRIKADNASKWAYTVDEEEIGWSDVEDYIEFEFSSPIGISEWITFERKIESLPVNGPFTITIYGIYTADNYEIYGSFKDIRFYSTSDELVIKRWPETKPKHWWWKRIWWGFGPTKEMKEDLQKVVDYTDIEEQAEREYVTYNDIDGDVLETNVLLGDVTDANMDNVLEQFAGALSIQVPDYDTAASDFDTDHSADYSDSGVGVTTSGGTIIFTGQATASKVSGDDFTGATTITNTDGDLTGSVADTQAYVTSVARVDKIVLTGGSGDATIGCNSHSGTITFIDTLENAINAFVAAESAAFAAEGVTLTGGQDGGGNWFVQFEAIQAGLDFVEDAYFRAGAPNLNGVASTAVPNVVGSARIDTVTLSGGIGTADILCDGETQEVECVYMEAHTTTWNTDGGYEESEATELLDLLCMEIAHQHSREKYFVNARLFETGTGITTLNTLGCFMDDRLVDDSIFPVRQPSLWTLSNCVLSYQDAQPQVDKILLSGINGACEFGTELGVKEQSFTYSLYNTAEAFVADHGAALLSINGIYVSMWVDGDDSDDDVYLVFIAATPGTGFTTVVHRTSGSLDGTIINVLPNRSTGVDPYACLVAWDWDSTMRISGLSIDGNIRRIINIRYKVLFGNPVTGQIFYTTALQTEQNYRNITLENDGEWHIGLFDMSDLVVGGTDWIDSIITGVRFDFTDQYPVVILLDWIGFDRKFVMNRGEFDVRNKKWNIDLIEIIP